MSGIDLVGLDTVVVVGGSTGGNPFGHVAIGVTGQGVCSYGTDTPLGGSLTDYLASQAAYRDSFVYILKTTPEQEAKMREQILKYRNTKLPKPEKDPFGAAVDTCATRTQSALEAGGITSILNLYISPFPRDTLRLARSNAEIMTLIPKGGAIPSSLSSFNR